MVRLSTAGLPEWLNACRRAGLEMRRSGRDWCGPCPVCQTGDDRFAIRAGQRRPVIVNARCGHTWLELMCALNPDTGSGGEVARTAAACRRHTPRNRRAADPRQLPQARNARRMLARAHRGRPTYFRKRFPNVDELVWTLDGTTWLVPLRIVRNGQLLPGLAGLQYILEDGTRRFQKDATTRGLVAVPRWTATGPLLLTEGVTSAMALFQAIQDPPLGILACLSRAGLVAASGQLGDRPGLVIGDRDRPDERGIEPGTEAAQKTSLPFWLPHDAPADPWDVWHAAGAELDAMQKWVAGHAPDPD